MKVTFQTKNSFEFTMDSSLFYAHKELSDNRFSKEKQAIETYCVSFIYQDKSYPINKETFEYLKNIG